MNSLRITLYSLNNMMNPKQAARHLLFRALIGATPAPTIAEITQARASLADDSAAQATLDELLAVITRTDRTPPSQWYDQLHAYAAAQLAGQGNAPEFAPTRRLLDADVALAEEYALLYETLRTEAAGQLPQPVVTPAADLSFLPTVARLRWAQPAAPPWRAQHKRVLSTPLAAVARLFQRIEHFPRLATAVTLLLVFLVGLWSPQFTPRRTTLAEHQLTLPTATAVSRIDPRWPEEPLLQWADSDGTRPTLVEMPSHTTCNGSVVNIITRRGCPM